MRRKFTIKQLLALMLVVLVGVFVQLRLNNEISTFRHDVENAESPLHRDAIENISNEFSAIIDAEHSISIDGISLDSRPSIIDYCLFRRTIECRCNLNVSYLRRELAHYKVPPHLRRDEYYVDVPSHYQTQQTVHMTATPFGFRIED